MRNILHCSFFVFSMLVVSCSPGEKQPEQAQRDDPKDYRVVGYVAGYRDFDFSKILAKKLTHINYAFANVIDGRVMFDTADIDHTSLKDDDLKALQKLKAVNPDLKILVSVGGWVWSGNFSDAALTAESRSRFAKSAADFVDKYGLDGIDIDWEYPNQVGAGNIHRVEDIENFTLLMKATREALSELEKQTQKGHYLLTIATGADSAYVSNTKLGEVAEYLDFLNIMTYDFYNGLHKTTGHHANLYPSVNNPFRISDVLNSVKLHEDAGVPLEKITIGIPFYGRRWEGVSPGENSGLYQPAESVGQIMFYRLIAEQCLNNDSYSRLWDESAKAPYLWNADSGIFISYEDAESIGYKIDYLKEKGLSGVMFWEYSDDDQGQLLDAVHEHLK
ncbi:MAG: glycoside hydrolase family 18 protein [Cytophagales bacterium]|nr:glycoside hydrolase family 18 protein [Cytophagales bacterium]